jgi:hypothetical protein
MADEAQRLHLLMNLQQQIHEQRNGAGSGMYEGAGGDIQELEEVKNWDLYQRSKFNRLMQDTTEHNPEDTLDI